jgi:ATP-dependent helicase HrpA
VPGLREEQVATLLRSLPKALRKPRQPLEPKTRELAAALQPKGDDLLAPLAELIQKRYGVIVGKEDFKPLPEHLRPRVEVLDRKNKPLAAGRDLAAVRAALDAQNDRSNVWECTAQKWEKQSITEWTAQTIGDLPESVVVEEIGGAPLLGYPGLELCESKNGGKDVRVTLFRKPAEADAASLPAVCFLAESALWEELASLGKPTSTAKPTRSMAAAATQAAASLQQTQTANAFVKNSGGGFNGLSDALSKLHIPVRPEPARNQASQPISAPRPALLSRAQLSAKIALGTATAHATSAPQPLQPFPKTALFPGLPEAVAGHAYRHLIAHVFRLEPPRPLMLARFDLMLASARRELPALLAEVRGWVAQSLQLRQEIIASAHAAASPRCYPGLETDLARLLPEDFPARTPHDKLPHLPRYLRAVQLRAERASLSPLAASKDVERARQLAPFLPGGACEKSLKPERRETFRWLLEEFRVSLFAQEHGTAQPASAQRLRTLAQGET